MPKGITQRTLLLVVAAVAAAIGLLIFSPSSPTKPALSPAPTSTDTANVPTEGRPGGFVSSASCRECHKDEHASWHRSYHRTMTQYATPEAVQGDFKGPTLRFNEDLFRLERSGDQFLAHISDASSLTNPAAPKEEITVPIRMITGSHHMQVYWLEGGKGNMMLGFPFTWLNESRRWVPRADTFLRDPSLPPPTEIWNQTCIRCHTTAGQPRLAKAEEAFHTRTAELGIACEACHGPGQAHVEKQKTAIAAGRIASTKERIRDESIVNPTRLDHVRSSQICGNCHSMKWFEANADWNENGFHYRPGDDLDKITPVMRPKELDKQPWLKPVMAKNPEIMSDFFWPDGMVRVSGRDYNGLIESPCFQKGTLSCLSCHSMHESEPANQLAKGKEGNQACLACHEKLKDNLAQHTRHGAESSGSLCYNCHMPHTTYGLMKAIRSHQITSPNVQKDLAAERPNACNLCHLDQTLSWTSQQLNKGWRTPQATLDREQTETPAGALWILKGDAGERALTAWHMGWDPARLISTNLNLGYLLGVTLNDPYAAVRYITARSLVAQPEWKSYLFDYASGEPVRAAATNGFWQDFRQPLESKLTKKTAQDLAKDRDDHPVHLRE